MIIYKVDSHDNTSPTAAFNLNTDIGEGTDTDSYVDIALYELMSCQKIYRKQELKLNVDPDYDYKINLYKQFMDYRHRLELRKMQGLILSSLFYRRLMFSKSGYLPRLVRNRLN